MQLPSFNEYNTVVDELLQSIKYIKFSKLVGKLIMKALEPLEKLLKKMFESSGIMSDSIAGAKFVLIGIVGLILIVLVGLIIFLMIRRKRKKRVRTILGEKIHKDSTVAEFLEKSKQYEKQGAYRQAIRLHFIAVLFYLHQNHFLYHDSTMTGKEMVERLKKENFIAIDSFDVLTRQFNIVWYGMKESDLETFKNWSNHEETFWQEVQR